MTEINLNKVSINFGFKKILDEFDLEVSTGERVAIIGSNGCGKTTILKIIMGIETPDCGTVAIKKNSTIGLLNQVPSEDLNDCKVISLFYIKFSAVFEIEQKIRILEQDMANESNSSKDLKKILKSYSFLQEKFETLGGYEIQQKIEKICSCFKISKDLLERQFNSLSGGEKTIISLASLLLSEPSILLLDEPTNHLDIETLEWLEQYLINYKGTIIISSHDRYFLDRVVNKIVLVDKGKSEIFFTNYSSYLEENERRIMQEFENYKNQQKQIDNMKSAIKKLREWGKIGDNESFFKRANCIEKRLEKLTLIDKPKNKIQLPLDFSINERSGKDVLSLENITIGIENNILFFKSSMRLQYGEKVCLIGKNGSGKSTLIKSIVNGTNIQNGNLKIGSNVIIGYMSQEITFENDNSNVLEECKKFFNGTETQLRATLAKFLFYGEKVFKKVGSLSGGEKVRLKLLELIQKKSNLLIFDEPTNHIDIDTREVLEEALKNFDGTLLFVSHDRYFINKLANRIICASNKKLTSYIGNYDYFKEKHFLK